MESMRPYKTINHPKFVIKSKLSQKNTDIENLTCVVTNQDVNLFINYMMNKSHRIK